MNRLKGSIEEVKVSGSLSQVTIKIGENSHIHSIIIETPDSARYLIKGQLVDVIFKETEVVLAKGSVDNLSMINRLPGKISEVKAGSILSEVSLITDAGPVLAIISREALDSMALKPGDPITAMVKLNEVMIAE